MTVCVAVLVDEFAHTPVSNVSHRAPERSLARARLIRADVLAAKSARRLCVTTALIRADVPDSRPSSKGGLIRADVVVEHEGARHGMWIREGSLIRADVAVGYLGAGRDADPGAFIRSTRAGVRALDLFQETLPGGGREAKVVWARRAVVPHPPTFALAAELTVTAAVGR